jgi:hypothetical protein
MSRHAVLVSCLATIAVVVPAGWTALDADIRGDGKALRPLQQETEIDGCVVTLDVDRSIVVIGDSVVATLRAYAGAPKRITVDLVAVDANSSEFSRMAPPSTTIDRETITLDAAPAGGPAVQTRIRLGTARRAAGVRDAFQIIAAKHDPKRKFDNPLFGDGDTAQVPVVGFSGSELGVRVAAETARAGEPIVVAVRVTNTTKKALRVPRVDVATSMADRYSSSIERLGDDSTDADDDAAAPFAPGTTIVRRFKLPTPEAGTTKLALVVDASARYPGKPQQDSDGMVTYRSADALDVVTIPIANPAVASKK